MRRLFLLCVLLALASAPGAAQGNTATTTQTGSGNTATATQTGTQHWAQIVQADGATATLTQGVSAASNGNMAYIQQQGASTATVTQSGNQDFADVAQRGTANTASLVQSGSNNVSLVYQGRSGVYYSHGGFDNVVPAVATNNQATVLQVGNGNGGFAINQLSTIDGGLIYQGVRGGHSVNNVAEVTQTGNQGQAWASQGDWLGASAGSEAIIRQAGEDNDASAVQGYYAASSATNAFASIEQTAGSRRNMTVVFQGVDGTSHTDRATVTQSGENHRASVFQGVADPTFGSQAGTASSSGNVVEVTQQAIGNEAFVYQGTGNGGAAALSTARVTQLSDGNLATVTQSGTSNLATVVQE